MGVIFVCFYSMGIILCDRDKLNILYREGVILVVVFFRRDFGILLGLCVLLELRLSRIFFILEIVSLIEFSFFLILLESRVLSGGEVVFVGMNIELKNLFRMLELFGLLVISLCLFLRV